MLLELDKLSDMKSYTHMETHTKTRVIHIKDTITDITEKYRETEISIDLNIHVEICETQSPHLLTIPRLRFDVRASASTCGAKIMVRRSGFTRVHIHSHT